MKKIFFQILFLLPLMAASQDTIQSHKLVKKPVPTVSGREYVYYYNDKPFSGIGIRYYNSTGQKFFQGSYKDGKKNGLHTLWYENGKKNWEEPFISGKLNGCCFYWNENGNKYLEVNYKDGEIHGAFIRWYENGQKSLEMKLEEGILVDKIRLYYKNGKISSCGEGVLITKDAITFKNAEPGILLEKEPDTTAYLSELIIANEFLQKGEWINYHENGQISDRGVYIPHSTVVYNAVYAENEYGNMELVFLYSDHISDKHGIWKYFSDDGKLVMERRYDNGVLIETK